MMVGTFCSWLTRFCFTILLLANLVTCTEMTMANFTYISFSVVKLQIFWVKTQNWYNMTLVTFWHFQKFDIFSTQADA